MHKYLNLWMDDKQSMINTMIRNMDSDAQAGYSIAFIKKELKEIQQYITDYESKLDTILKLKDNEIELYCKVDLIASGAISAD